MCLRHAAEEGANVEFPHTHTRGAQVLSDVGTLVRRPRHSAWAEHLAD